MVHSSDQLRVGWSRPQLRSNGTVAFVGGLSKETMCHDAEQTVPKQETKISSTVVWNRCREPVVQSFGSTCGC